jgi:EH_Signature domain
VLVNAALLELERGLASALESMSIGGGQFGAPQLIEVSSKESEKLFQGYASAKPSKEDAYAAALAFMRGQSLDLRQRDLIASALAVPIREQVGAKALGSKRLASLLGEYEVEARAGDLWRLTWYALMSSYFAFDAKGSTSAEHSGWQDLRLMLERTWPMIDRETGPANVPDWVKVLRQEAALLTEDPTAKYAREYLGGNQELVNRLANDLGISQSSWFWHSLVLSAVRSATSSGDMVFRKSIPRLLELIEERPVYRDEAVEAILVRYNACKETPLNENLRNYVVRKDVWRNPKLKSAGIATAWNRVPDAVWQMVLGWVNERNLKDFFDILAARNMADEGRLAFWSKYMKQISWTRLVFGSETIALKNSNPEIRDLIAREEGSYATLTANQTVDAFMMGIGEFIIVEFSKKPNAAYVYRASSMKFDRNSRYYSGGTDDLKYGFHDKNELRVTHPPGWQHEATAGLNRLGIAPDTPGAQRARTSTVARTATPAAPSQTSSSHTFRGDPRLEHSVEDCAPPGANFTMKELQFLMKRFPKARIKDSRSSRGGRLWVEDPIERSQLAAELKTYGFKWANSRSAWYYVES